MDQKCQSEMNEGEAETDEQSSSVREVSGCHRM